MVVITFADRAAEKQALAFLLGRFSGRVLKSGEHLVPEAALEALADQNILFTVKGRATYAQQMAALRGTPSRSVQRRQAGTTARLEARLLQDVLVRLKRAAEIQGRTLTDFVVAAADEAACRAIEQTEIIRLSVADQRQIAEALLHPPAPNAALKKAAKRHRELFGAE